uniref:Candidate secreted effector n=1 Tax=Meloidogyne incognita TaxID=6306 RepID=A0A914LC65_MELIC
MFFLKIALITFFPLSFSIMFPFTFFTIIFCFTFPFSFIIIIRLMDSQDSIGRARLICILIPKKAVATITEIIPASTYASKMGVPTILWA